MRVERARGLFPARRRSEPARLIGDASSSCVAASIDSVPEVLADTSDLRLTGRSDPRFGSIIARAFDRRRSTITGPRGVQGTGQCRTDRLITECPIPCQCLGHRQLGSRILLDNGAAKRCGRPAFAPGAAAIGKSLLSPPLPW